MKLKYQLVTFVAAAALMASVPAYANSLRVCADPNYLPFSNEQKQGFENRVAEAMGNWLGWKVEYYWQSERAQGGYDEFLQTTLNAKKCDVVMSIPYASLDVLTTHPYFISSYVFVFRKDKNYDITSMDSADLTKVELGFESNTPPEDGLKLRGLVKHAIPFNVGEQAGASPDIMLRAVQEGSVDVMITWEPAIGYFLSKYPNLEVVGVPNARSVGGPEQYTFPVSMGVRRDDEALRGQLDKVIEQHKDALTSILASLGVKLYMPEQPGQASGL